MMLDELATREGVQLPACGRHSLRISTDAVRMPRRPGRPAPPHSISGPEVGLLLACSPNPRSEQAAIGCVNRP